MAGAGVAMVAPKAFAQGTGESIETSGLAAADKFFAERGKFGLKKLLSG